MRIVLKKYRGYLLLIPLFIFLIQSPAIAIDFITEEDYLSDESDYKDYPLNMLFKKLHEASWDGLKDYVFE